MTQLYLITVCQFRRPSCPYWSKGDHPSKAFYVEGKVISQAERKALSAYRASGTMEKNFRQYTAPVVTEGKLVTREVVR